MQVLKRIGARLAKVGYLIYMKPIRTINPGEVGLRVNRVTGHVAQLHEGWAVVLPGVHELRRSR